jgi:hypothetical protein
MKEVATVMINTSTGGARTARPFDRSGRSSHHCARCAEYVLMSCHSTRAGAGRPRRPAGTPIPQSSRRHPGRRSAHDRAGLSRYRAHWTASRAGHRRGLTPGAASRPLRTADPSAVSLSRETLDEDRTIEVKVLLRRRPAAEPWNIRPSRGSIGEGDSPSRPSISQAIFQHRVAGGRGCLEEACQ